VSLTRPIIGVFVLVYVPFVGKIHIHISVEFAVLQGMCQQHVHTEVDFGDLMGA